MNCLFIDAFRTKVDYDVPLKTERPIDNQAKFATKKLSKFTVNWLKYRKRYFKRLSQWRFLASKKAKSLCNSWNKKEIFLRKKPAEIDSWIVTYDSHVLRSKHFLHQKTSFMIKIWNLWKWIWISLSVHIIKIPIGNQLTKLTTSVSPI